MQACGVMKVQRTHADQDKGNMFLKENEYSQHQECIMTEEWKEREGVCNDHAKD